MFQRTIVFDPYFTHAAVFVPPGIDIDLAQVCATSGYIHSAGYSVYIRKAEKSEPGHLSDALTRHIKKFPPPKGERLFFAAYAHEDFTKHDRDDEEALRHGLDGVKFHLEKFFLANRPLVEVLKEIGTKFKKHLYVAEPGPFLAKHPGPIERKVQKLAVGRTLWLIRDRDTENTEATQTPNVYLVCYDQRFINHNPFHIFDENKPAWIAHTTIPHTLAGAMLNLTRPVWPDAMQPTVADPFAGTGTLWFEVFKYGCGGLKLSDINPLAPMLSSDNRNFFAQSPLWLCELCQALTDLLARLDIPVPDDLAKHEENADIQRTPSVDGCNVCPLRQTPTEVKGDDLLSIFDSAFVQAQDLHRVTSTGSDVESRVAAEHVRDEIGQWKPAQRLIFYLAMRTHVRHAIGFDRKSKDWKAAFAKETCELRSQIAKLARLWKRSEEADDRRLSRNPHLGIYEGMYSEACVIPRKALEDELHERRDSPPVEVRDARELPAHQFTAVISDPPYGINTKEDSFDLATLWKNALKKMLGALQSGGNLVLCLPHRSHIGKGIGPYTQAAFVLRQLQALADEMKLEITNLVPSLPMPASAEPWFYWESEKALRRSILHLRVTHRTQ